MIQRLENSARLLRALGFWASLIVAVGLVSTEFRFAMPPESGCANTVLFDDAESNDTTASIPFARVPRNTVSPWVRVSHDFILAKSPTSLQAVYLGDAAPFYLLHINGLDLTPAENLNVRNRRDLAPHLYPLPRGLLHAGANRVEIELPVAVSLSEVRLGLMCLGDYAVLAPIYRTNWWNQVGIPYLSLAMLGSLVVFAALFWRLGDRPPALRWYLIALLLMMVRVAYGATTWKPGGPLIWYTLSNISVVAVIYVLYRLVAAMWQFRLSRLERALRWFAIGSSVAFVANLQWDWQLSYPHLNLLLWLAIAGSAGVLGITVARAAERAHPLEWRVVLWGMLFGAMLGALEAVTYPLPMTHRLVSTYPLATMACGLAFGLVLARRSALGMDVLTRATAVLARDVDLALRDPVPTAGTSIVEAISNSIAGEERQRVLRDIHDGFGSRLVAILVRVRREQPDSPLCADIQRALLDMRLIIDAMGESARTLDVALATLRHRLEPMLLAVGLESSWDLEGVYAVQVDDRRKLMQLFRCVEELISNVLQHALATRIEVRAAIQRGELYVSTSDNGCGFPPIIHRGNGLNNIEQRVTDLGGRWSHRTGASGRGTTVEIIVPRI